MRTQWIIGLVLLVVGLVLLYFGYNATQSVGEQVVEGLTGRFSDKTMWYLLGGIAAIAGGVALAFFGPGRHSKV
jgi:drug/metabolite transporter (DMT)-like permease